MTPDLRHFQVTLTFRIVHTAKVWASTRKEAEALVMETTDMPEEAYHYDTSVEVIE
mgnify:CR=1 FL=1